MPVPAGPPRAIVPTDHAALLSLWRRTPGIQIRAEDAYASFCAYLQRNPGLSLLIEADGRPVACLMAGLGIHKSQAFVLRDAPDALDFRHGRDGWGERQDIAAFSTRTVDA